MGKEPLPAPEGTRPMMISMREMETLGLKTGSGLRETVPYKLLDKTAVLEQVAQVGFMSPFHEFRAELAKLAGDEILIIADPTETYGENWLLCLTRRALETQLDDIREREDRDAREAKERERESSADGHDDVASLEYEDRPVIPRAWESATARETHEDVEALAVKPSRPLIKLSVTKMSDEFNADYKFSDRDADQCFVEWRQHKDPNYELSRMEQDVGLQGLPPLIDNSTQTSWFRSVNSAIQYAPRELDASARSKEMDSDKMQAFLAKMLPRVERALQQNETLDIFLDPFAHLVDEDTTLASKSEASNVRELRGFTDLVFSKNKTLPAVDWHPRKHGVVAVAAAANANFSKRLDLLDKIDSSFVLVWNFADLIHPQFMLEAPQDALAMRFNPSAPHIVAAGLHNGQVLVWDTSKADSHAHSHVASTALKTKANISSSVKGAGGTTTTSTTSSSGGDDGTGSGKHAPPPVKPLYISYIDASHRRPVADLMWLPAGMEVNNRGHLVPATDAGVHQFVTIAGDGQVAIWDLRFKDPKYRGISRNKADKASAAAAAAAAGKDGQQAPEVHFTPIYAITLGKIESAGELTLACLVLDRPRDDFGGFSSRFYCGTEEGEFVYADWRPHATTTSTSRGGRDDDGERGGGGEDGGVQYVQWLHRDHSRPIIGLCASPFFPHIFLTASESHFHLWNVAHQQKDAHTAAAAVAASSSSQQQSGSGSGSNHQAHEQQHGPIFVSPLSSATITCVAFSPTRPGVIFLGKSDGMLEVWDFLDQSHRASLTMGVTACALTSIAFRPPISNSSGTGAASATTTNSSGAGAGAASNAAAASSSSSSTSAATGNAPASSAAMAQQPAKQQLVAIGDQIGNLHILEVPRSLARAFTGEKQAVEAYFKRESERARAAARAFAVATSTMGDAPRLTSASSSGPRDSQNTADNATTGAPTTSAGTGARQGTGGLAAAGDKDAEDELFKRMETDFRREMGIDTTAA